MIFSIIDSDDPLSEGDFAQAQAKMGVELPDDLRKFFSWANGGRPSKRLFISDNDGFLVDYFLPLAQTREGPECDVVSIFKIWRAVGTSETLHKSIPIAYDTVGDNLLYSLDEKTFGAIFYSRADAEPENRVRHLCGSLEEFLLGLQEWS
jgi:hypothetical protein